MCWSDRGVTTQRVSNEWSVSLVPLHRCVQRAHLCSRSASSRRCSPEIRRAVWRAQPAGCWTEGSAPGITTAWTLDCASVSTRGTEDTLYWCASSPDRRIQTQTRDVSSETLFTNEHTHNNRTELVWTLLTLGARNWEDLLTTHLGREPKERDLRVWYPRCYCHSNTNIMCVYFR